MKKQAIIAIAIMFLLVLTRIPGLMPPNFSAVYAILFCAGVYFPTLLAWVIPIPTLLASDILLNLHYGAAPVHPYMASNYIAYVVIIFLGQQFNHRTNFLKLLSGGLLGAVLFYLITNTISFFCDPGYVKSLAGWIQALTTGIPGLPPTWMFFKGTFLSAGAFTALFAGAMKAAEHFVPEEVPDEDEESEPDEDEDEAPVKEPT